MRVAELDYALPPHLVAQTPSPERDGARLLVVDPKATDRSVGSAPLGGAAGAEMSLVDSHVRDLVRWLPRRALLVVNDTRVFRARLLGQKVGSGGRAEVFLLRRAPSRSIEEGPSRQRWHALAKSNKPLRPGQTVDIRGLSVALVEKHADATWTVDLTSDEDSIAAHIERVGQVPLPPYIKRGQADRDSHAFDDERYQTVYAKESGSVAAPTAGLHFSKELLEALQAAGHPIAHVTLHVGLGTFQPVTAEDFSEHPMHEEEFSISEGTAGAVARARAEGRAVVAIGTTVTRALESAADGERPGHVRAVAASTRLLIQPGYRFRVVDALFTNFHLPKSTLLALVCAFGGTNTMLSAYRHAVRAEYRFFSYGDAMLIRPPALSYTHTVEAGSERPRVNRT
jgi:S-adenosylmethionine:tRNA ribosyltransferase-isomerase